MNQPTKIGVCGLMIAALLNITACTTTGTKERVLAEPMTEDLEAQVLKETGISGAVAGAVVGSVATGGLTFLALAASGRPVEEAIIGGVAGAVAGAAGGGALGYQMGKKEGEKAVAQAMDRDQVAKYLQGARAYNNRLAQNNMLLQKEVISIRQINDPKKKKLRIQEASLAARKELKRADQRVAARTKAVESLDWPAGEKSAYKQQLAVLAQQRNKLANTVVELTELEPVTI